VKFVGEVYALICGGFGFAPLKGVREAALFLFLLAGDLGSEDLEIVEEGFDCHGSAVAESADVVEGERDAQFAEYFVWNRSEGTVEGGPVAHFAFERVAGRVVVQFH
jgi:hypothetical protein